MAEYGLVSLVASRLVSWLVCSRSETLVPSLDALSASAVGCVTVFGSGGVRSSEPVGMFRHPDGLFQYGGKGHLLK